MRDVTVQKLHEIIGGRLRLAARCPLGGETAAIGPIATDTRQMQPGSVFWALCGATFDGGSFLDDAFARGALGAVASKYIHPPSGCWSLQVDDSQVALERLAQWNRRRACGRVIAVTGSVGKTTTRQMIRSVLEARYSGTASPKNFNNRVGVPLAMLGIEPQHDFAVLELAASGPGEIGQLAALCQPQIGVISRIGEAHLGGFGSLDAVARAKTELLGAIVPGGWAVMYGDDARLRRAAADSPLKTIWFGRSLENDLVATSVRYRQGLLSFSVDGTPMCVHAWGRHHLYAALAAIAVGRICGLSDDEIAEGLGQFQPPPMRCQVTRIGGATIIDDSYNASPSAMQAALELLRDFDAPGRRIVICGDMRELGEASDHWHRRLGDQVVTVCGADLLVACGQHAPQVVEGAQAAGMPREHTVACREPNEVRELSHTLLAPGDVVLIKGSRAMAMERLVETLSKSQSTGQEIRRRPMAGTLATKQL